MKSTFHLSVLLYYQVLLVYNAKSLESTTSITCRDESGDPVDWFVVIKFPDGADYAYTDSTRRSNLQKSPFTLTSTDEGAVAATLSGIYNNASNNIGYALYNDEWPNNRRYGTGGHAKGVFGFDDDSKGGFWLVHSVPRFPEYPSKGAYPALPEDEYRYGQSMLCISMDLDELDRAASQLLIAYPWTYDAKIPSHLNLTNMLRLAKPNHRDHYADVGVKTLFSKDDVLFTSFYKSPHWGTNYYLYEDMVEPYYDVDMMWETWMNGVNPDPTFCRPDYQYNSMNIRYIQVTDEAVWKETKDHSKWGLSVFDTDNNKKVVCIGDINRQQSQNKRGGGTNCLEDDNLWSAFSQIVIKSDDCHSNVGVEAE